jgi:hypothetical protein
MQFIDTQIKTHLIKSIKIQKTIANQAFNLNLKFYRQMLAKSTLSNEEAGDINRVHAVKTLLNHLLYALQNYYYKFDSSKNSKHLETSKELISKCVEIRSREGISVIANNRMHVDEFEKTTRLLLVERSCLKKSDLSYTSSRKDLLKLFEDFDLKKNKHILEELKMRRKEMKKTMHFYHFLFFVFTNKKHTENYLEKSKRPFRIRYRHLPEWFTQQFLKDINLDSDLGIPANNYLSQNYNIGKNKKKKDKQLGYLKWNTNCQFKNLENRLDQLHLADTLVDGLKGDKEHYIFFKNFKLIFKIDLEHWQRQGISKNDKNNIILKIEKIKQKKKRYLTGHPELYLLNIERQLFFFDKILTEFYNSLLFQKVVQKSIIIPEEIRRKKPKENKNKNKRKKLKKEYFQNYKVK